MIRQIRTQLKRLYYNIVDDRLAKYYLYRKGVKFDSSAITLHGIPYVNKAPNSVIQLGTGALLNSREWSTPLALDHATALITYENSKIVIGDHCSMSGVIFIAQTEITIGDHTMIGSNTRIYDTDFHPSDPAMRRENSTRGAVTKPITIGNNVFIGCHVHILKGVTIGDNAIVPAGAIVYRDVPAREFPENHSDE